MLTVKLVCIGSLKEAYWKQACAEYVKRLSPLCNFVVTELPEVRTADSPALIEKALGQEAQQIIKAVQGCVVIPLCIEGAQQSSAALSQTLEGLALQGHSSVAFVIGSSHGLSPQIKALGKGLSMSGMTFPHQLARVMLCEQIYRAFQILAGTKYHK